MSDSSLLSSSTSSSMLHNLLLFQNSSLASLFACLLTFALKSCCFFSKKTNKQENKNTAQVLNADYTKQSRPLYGTCVNARGDCYTLRRPARRRLGYIGAREKEQKKEEAGASDAAGGSPAFTKTCNQKDTVVIKIDILLDYERKTYNDNNSNQSICD
ncbi:hypothetical protein T10_11600 [Trichinella papuae]|uniref:Uncharacterized protein n=1 Tax=Trichinella papuae TaxID=268474 RepID=A0A0V1MRR5_9BILA|nr:hypothetical protein T10_11600 [Trichinella papuae]